MTRADDYISVDDYDALGRDFHRFRDLAESRQRELEAARCLIRNLGETISQLYKELKIWETNCTGKHGSQENCAPKPCICKPPQSGPNWGSASSADPMCPVHGGIMQNGSAMVFRAPDGSCGQDNIGDPHSSGGDKP